MSDTDCCIALAIALAIRKRNKKTRKKRVWMKDQLRKRSDHLRNESPSPDFKNALRMDESAYDELLKLIAPKIAKRDTLMRDAIPADQRLSITLRFLATGDKFANIKSTSNISEQSIGRICMETCEAIIEVLKDYIKMPTTQDGWKQVADDFNQRWNFPNCLGALDGMHVAIKKPPDSSSAYYNYKKFFSIVLMAIVNANYEFLMVDVGVNGRISDGGILSITEFGKSLSENGLNCPDPCLLPMGTKKLPFVFVGDEAFQLSDNLMKPYSQAGRLTVNQQIFNYRLNRPRRLAENTFGILASRFTVLQRTIGLSPEKAQTIVLACCYLHNFLRRKTPQQQFFSKDSVDVEQLKNGAIAPGSWRNDCKLTSLERATSRISTSNAKAIRDSFCKYFNKEGAVSWQNKFLN